MTDRPGLRTGVCLLPDVPWREMAPRWRDAEAMGFASAWTYDHLSWRSLRDGPWHAMVPLLAAAAGVTERVRLGPLVTSPNFRHPVTLAKEVMTLDDLSGGRIDLGLGAGGTGADATVLGGDALPGPARAARFEEFVALLDRLLTEPAVTAHGPSYDAVDARTIPGCLQRPRVPFTVAGAGRRAIAVAARHGQRWVTYGPLDEALTGDEWHRGVRDQARVLDDACRAAGRDPHEVERVALIGLTLGWAQDSLSAWEDLTGRLVEAGFAEVVVHWPRPGTDLPGPAPDVFAALAPAA